jgi:hypothetical protein
VNSLNNVSKYQAIPSIDRDYTEVVIKLNETKFNSSTSRLNEYAKNPNFYRNRQIMGVVASLAAAPVLAVLAVVCFAAVGAEFAKAGTGRGSGVAAAGWTSIPLVAAAAVIGLVIPLFASFNSDTKALADLNVFTSHIQSKIADCEQNIQRSNQALQEEFSENAWEGMRGISSEPYLHILDLLPREESKRAVLLKNQDDIVVFRAANALAKARLEAVLARFQSRNVTHLTV